jgi:hypothetical protein
MKYSRASRGAREATSLEECVKDRECLCATKDSLITNDKEAAHKLRVDKETTEKNSATVDAIQLYLADMDTEITEKWQKVAEEVEEV